jgi:hypothetical protein
MPLRWLSTIHMAHTMALEDDMPEEPGRSFCTARSQPCSMPKLRARRRITVAG